MWVKRASHLERISCGVWDYITREASLCPCDTQRLSPWPQRKGGERKKKQKTSHGYYFLKLFSSYASLGIRALEKKADQIT